jgi:hypothetical protein
VKLVTAPMAGLPSVQGGDLGAGVERFGLNLDFHGG